MCPALMRGRISWSNSDRPDFMRSMIVAGGYGLNFFLFALMDFGLCVFYYFLYLISFRVLRFALSDLLIFIYLPFLFELLL